MPEAIRQGDIPGVQLRRRQPLPVSREEAWRWLTEPERKSLWLAEPVEGRLLESIPPALLVLAFDRPGWTAATRLTFRIHARGDGCEVDVLQDGFQRLPLSIGLTVWETWRRRWRDDLARLAEVAASSV